MFVNVERSRKSEQSGQRSECNLMRDLRYPCWEYIRSLGLTIHSPENTLADFNGHFCPWLCSVGQWEARPRKPVSVLVQRSATWNRNDQGKFVRCTLLPVAVINLTVTLLPFSVCFLADGLYEVLVKSDIDYLPGLENLCLNENCFLIVFLLLFHVSWPLSCLSLYEDKINIRLLNCFNNSVEISNKKLLSW